jgi:hypothetical protein
MKLVEGADIITRLGKTNLLVVPCSISISRHEGLLLNSTLGSKLSEIMPDLTGYIHDHVVREHRFLGSAVYFHPFTYEDPKLGTIHLGLFQVSMQPKGPLDLIVVRNAIHKLFGHIIHMHIDLHPTGWQIDMEFPNINGQVKCRKEVESLLELLPDNVRVWQPVPLGGNRQLSFYT